ncbi:hypothetical protein FRC07_006457 [Ceratobasidium sp. 392]|nr:hypothetical protein FRC07_006457 [Ceratobasidium sp. 392]
MLRQSNGGGASSSNSVKSSIWHSVASTAKSAIRMPLPGFVEIQRTARGLIDDMEIQGYTNEEWVSLTRRVERLLLIIQGFDGPLDLGLSELSRWLHEIKQRLNDENKCVSRFGVSNAERRQRLLDELRNEITERMEEVQFRMQLQSQALPKHNPLDNFPVIQAYEITKMKLIRHRLYQEDFANSVDKRRSLSLSDTVVARTYRGQLGRLPVVYTTYVGRTEGNDTQKIAEDHLRYLDRNRCVRAT